MTSRQSNIIFYSVISLIVYALIINALYPEFFDKFTKSKQELSIQEAINKGDHKTALTIYQQLAEERINSKIAVSAETAKLYEEMAELHRLLGDKSEEKMHYLKSLAIKEQLKKINLYGFAKTYEKLASLAEEEKQYDQAQSYYEKSLSKRLGNTTEGNDEGLFVGMQKTRQRYLKLNNEETIATFKKLAEIHNVKKEFDIAKTYYEKALEASKETFGEDDVKTLEIRKLMNQITL